MASLSIYLRLIGAQVRGQMQYRVSFILMSWSTFSSTIVELLAVIILFNTFSSLGGWSLGEVALLYGLVSVAFGFTDTIGSGFENVATLIRTGDFDRMLVRPMPTFVQVLSADFQLRRLGRVAQGLVALGLAQWWLGMDWTLAKALVFTTALASTSVVFFTVLLLGAALCFWTIERSEVQNIFTYGGTEMASYPMHIYNRWMQAAFILIVPLTLTTYYPAIYLLDKPDLIGLPGVLRFTAPLVAAAFLAVGLWVWGQGMRHYQSTGS